VKFNPNKTDIMIFSTRHLENNLLFDFNNISLSPVHIHIRKSNGPKTDSWGTPAFYSPVLDIASLITNRCFNHLHINKLLYKFQSGFLPGYSTTHQLIELYDNILLALDKKQITSITFADISKAFDAHQPLIPQYLILHL
jgi:hypothetical protein